MLGCGASAQKGGANVSSTAIGAGRSNAFKIAALDANSTFCFMFEITAESKSDKKGAANPNEVFNMQFGMKYLHYDGTWRRRVTTLSRRWVSGSSQQEILLGFDQEAAAVMMARVCTWKMETEEDFDATRFIDRALIRLCQRCAWLMFVHEFAFMYGAKHLSVHYLVLPTSLQDDGEHVIRAMCCTTSLPMRTVAAHATYMHIILCEHIASWCTCVLLKG